MQECLYRSNLADQPEQEDMFWSHRGRPAGARRPGEGKVCQSVQMSETQKRLTASVQHKRDERSGLIRIAQ